MNRNNLVLRATYEGQRYDLDTFESIPFRVDVSAIQNNEIGNVFGVASQNIDLPGSDTNNKFFDAAYNVNSPDVKGFKHSVPCQVLQQGAEVFTGNLILNKVVTDGGSDTSYSVTLVNESVDFTNAIKETYLSNLDYSDLAHTYDITSITSSWEDGIAGGDVYYPLVDYGLDGTDPSIKPIQFGGTNGKIDNTASPLQIQQFKPAVRVKSVLDKIFESANYQYESTFFDSAEFSSIYTLTTNSDKLGITTNQSQDSGFSAEKTGSQVLPGPLTFLEDVNFNREIYDPAGGYNINTSQFVVSNPGTYAFKASLDFTKNVIGKISLCRIFLLVNNVQVANTFYDIKNINVGTMAFTTAGFTLGIGDVVQLAINWDGYDVAINPIDLTLEPTSTFGTIYAPIQVVGGTVDMGQQFDPQIKALDFLKGIIQKFNLIIEPKKNERNTLIIEPFDTWADSGVTKDWSDKFDRATKVSVKHPIQDQPASIVFSDGDDGDSLTAYAKNNFDNTLTYGGHTYVSDSDIPQGTRRVGGFFSPLPAKGIPQGPQIIIPHLYRKDGTDNKAFKFKPRLGYRIDDQSAVGATNGQYFIYDAGSTSSVGLNSYSTISSLQSYPIGTGSSLHFDAAGWYPFHQNQADGKTPLGAFSNYWGRYINELYDDSARILTLNMQFDPIDLKDIQLNDKIFIDNAYYRINKISGFNISDRDNVMVELLKTPIRQFKFPRRIINDIDLGVYDVEDFQPRGNVVVRNPEGEEVTGSAELKQFATLEGYTFLSGSVYWASDYNGYLNALNEQNIVGNVQVDDAAGAIIGTQDGGSIAQGVDKALLVGTNNVIESNVKNSVISGDTITVGADSDNLSVLSSETSTIKSGSTDVALMSSKNATIGGTKNTMITTENCVMETNQTQSMIIGGESITFAGNNIFERHTHIGGDGFSYYSDTSGEGIETFENSVGLGQLPDVASNPGVSKTNKVIIGDSILTGAQYIDIKEETMYLNRIITFPNNGQEYLTRLSWSTASGSGTSFIFLPDATVNHGRFIRFLTDGTWPDASPQASVSIVPSGSQQIDGSAEVVLSKDYDGIGIVSTGTEWAVIQRKA